MPMTTGKWKPELLIGAALALTAGAVGIAINADEVDKYLTRGIESTKQVINKGIKRATERPVDNILEYEEGKYAVQFSDGQIFTFVDGKIGFREGFLAPMRRSVGPVLSSEYGWALEEVTEEVNRRAGLYNGRHLQDGQRVLVPAFPDSALEQHVAQAYTTQEAQTVQQAGR
jgi:hypothetical protein